MNKGQSSLILVGLILLLGLNKSGAQEAPQLFPVGETQRFVSFDYANVDVVIAGVAGGDRVVFVGEPLNGSVVAHVGRYWIRPSFHHPLFGKEQVGDP